MDQTPGLVLDEFVMLDGLTQLVFEALLMSLCTGNVLQKQMGRNRQNVHTLSHLQQAPFRVSNQAEIHFAFASTSSAKSAHDLFQVLLQILGLVDQGRFLRCLCDGLDELEEFFFAL